MNVIRPTHAVIDLKAIDQNMRQIKRRVGNVKVMAVVKANAYGHGDVQVARTVLNAGAEWLGVAIAEEGISLRAYFPEIPILAFVPAVVDQLPLYIENGIDITLCSIEVADALNALAGVLKKKAFVQIKVDTGMGRVGVPWEEAVEFYRHVVRLQNITIRGIYTHFARADESDKTYTRLQLDRFNQVLTILQKDGYSVPLRHCANSGAILDMGESFLDMVRPGIMVYGYYPSNEVSRSIDLKPALSLYSRINFIKRVPAGTPLSYGGKHVVRKETKIASVTIGYGDGYSRLLSAKADALIGGRRYPVVGLICMDQILVDVGTEPSVQLGDRVTLIGSDGADSITAWSIAETLGTIPYEVFCQISQRVPRIYVE
jgi:alanine racemase